MYLYRVVLTQCIQIAVSKTHIGEKKKKKKIHRCIHFSLSFRYPAPPFSLFSLPFYFSHSKWNCFRCVVFFFVYLFEISLCASSQRLCQQIDKVTKSINVFCFVLFRVCVRVFCFLVCILFHVTFLF